MSPSRGVPVRRCLTALLSVAAVAAALVAAPARPAHAAVAAGASWVRSVNGGAPGSGSPAPQPYGGAAVGDLFGNGGREVVAGFPNGNVYAWDAGGTLLWTRSGGGGPISSSVTLADLDGNGRQEVIASTQGGWISVFYPDGSPYPGWPKLVGPRAANFQIGFFSSVAVGDLFGNGGKG